MPTQREAVARIGKSHDAALPAPAAIGHRVVHGGPKLRQHCLIDEEVILQQLEAASAFAPLHTLGLIGDPFCPEALSGSAANRMLRHDIPYRFAGFARVLPITAEWLSEGIQRYGFHGLCWNLSCISLATPTASTTDHRPSRQWRQRHGGHRNGKSIDTSMGLTPIRAVLSWERVTAVPDPGRADLPDA